MDKQRATTVVRLKQPGTSAAADCVRARCVQLAMASALGEFRHSVTGTVVQGRAYLRGTVETPENRDRIEQSVRQLACVVDVINDVAVGRSAAVRSGETSHRPGAQQNHPLLYVSNYCSLDQHALELLISKSLVLLTRELGDAAPAVTEVIVLYYLWHEEAAMVDIALPCAHALDRRPAGLVRGTILPHVARWTRPKGGVAGLSAARQRLAKRCGADPTDPFFRVWQSVPLANGALPANWLEAPLKTAS